MINGKISETISEMMTDDLQIMIVDLQIMIGCQADPPNCQISASLFTLRYINLSCTLYTINKHACDKLKEDTVRF